MEAPFERRYALVSLDAGQVQALLEDVTSHRVTGCALLPGGFCNTNYRVSLDGPPHVLVLRVAVHEPQAWRKQARLLRLVRDRVAVPEVLLAAAGHPRLDHPYLVLSWIDGIPLNARLEDADARELGQAVGRQLSRIGTFRFPEPGLLDGDLQVSVPFSTIASSLRAYLHETVVEGRAGRRLGTFLHERLLAHLEANIHYVERLPEDRALVHADFNGKNILVHPDRPEVAAILDWDFAFSGPPLADLGNLMRYPSPVAFEEGVLQGFGGEGGTLPTWWRRASRLLDLSAHCEFLNALEERPRRFADSVRLVQKTLDEWEMLPS